MTIYQGDDYALDDGTVDLVRLARFGGPVSRAEISERTGWARVTVNQRLDRAVESGVLSSAGQSTSARGRPAARFGINAGRAQLLLADIGASGMRLAATDLEGRVLRRVDQTIRIADGPEVVLAAVETGLAALREESVPVWGVGVSVP